MSNGKNKDVLRALYKTETEKEPLTAKGSLTKEYTQYLEKACKPHWASVLSKFGNRIAEIDEGKTSAQAVLDQSRKLTILEEKCSLGVGSNLSKKKKLWEEKYEIKF